MKLLTLIGFILLSSTTLVTSSYINCTYEYFYGYRCTVTYLHIDSKEHQFLYHANGDHLDNKTNEDITAITFSTNVEYFPRNLEGIFPNLHSIAVLDGGLTELTNADLKPFGENLSSLWLNGNKIEVLERDLFADSPNIDTLIFQDNQIKKIERGTFDSLKKLKTLNLERNQCIKSGAFGSIYGVKRLIARAEARCQGEN